MNVVSDQFPDQRICILGLGYVGLTLAVVMAGVGFKVDGVEARPDLVERLGRGDPHFLEPGLERQMARSLASGHLRVTATIPEDCRATVFIVTVGTPLDKNGEPRLDTIVGVGRQIAAVLKPNDLVVLRSTVRIGSTRNLMRPILDEAGVPYGIAFCPERTVEGQALAELRHLPQIIGADDEATRQRASRLFSCLTPTVVQVGQPETAELIKLVDNTYRDLSFAFANEVADICDALGVPVTEVVGAGKLHYARTSVPLPGPVGGPCLEKDPHILAHSLRGTGAMVSLAQTARQVNEGQPAAIAARLAAYVAELPGWPEAPVVTIAGLAFKGRPVTGDLRGSMAIPLLAALRTRFPDAIFRVFDPVAAPAEVDEAFQAERAETLETAFAGASLVIIANNHPMFGTANIEGLSETMARPALVYDLWNQFAAGDLELPSGTAYVALGDGRLPITHARPESVRAA